MDVSRPHVPRVDGPQYKQLLHLRLHALGDGNSPGDRRISGLLRSFQGEQVLARIGTYTGNKFDGFLHFSCDVFQFFCLLLVILVAEIAAAVWAYVHADMLEPILRNSVKATVQDEYRDNESRRNTFDTIQSQVMYSSRKIVVY